MFLIGLTLVFMISITIISFWFLKINNPNKIELTNEEKRLLRRKKINKRLYEPFNPADFINSDKEVERLSELLKVESKNLSLSPCLTPYYKDVCEIFEQFQKIVQKTNLLVLELKDCFSEDSLTYDTFISPTKQLAEYCSYNMAVAINSYLGRVWCDNEKIRRQNIQCLGQVDHLLKKIIKKKNEKIEEYEEAIEHFSELSERLDYYDLD